jgi:hypothetical protein
LIKNSSTTEAIAIKTTNENVATRTTDEQILTLKPSEDTAIRRNTRLIIK